MEEILLECTTLFEKMASGRTTPETDMILYKSPYRNRSILVNAIF